VPQSNFELRRKLLQLEALYDVGRALNTLRPEDDLLEELMKRTEYKSVIVFSRTKFGADRIARALRDDGCRTFFVAHTEEGISLRKVLGPGPRVIVLHGPPPGDEAELPEHELIPVLSAPWQIRAWSNLARQLDRPLPAVLQIDSGMTRFGLSDREIDEITAEPASLMGLDVVLVMSHLACADNPAHPANAAQLATFKGLRKRLPAAPASLAASSGIFLGRDYRFDLVRPGAALYGIAPQLGPTNPMHPSPNSWKSQEWTPNQDGII